MTHQPSILQRLPVGAAFSVHEDMVDINGNLDYQKNNSFPYTSPTQPWSFKILENSGFRSLIRIV